MTETTTNAPVVHIGDPGRPIRHVVMVHEDAQAVVVPTAPPPPAEADPDDVLDAFEVAKLLGLTKSGVEKRAARGKIPSFKDGWNRRYIRRDILAHREQLKATTTTDRPRNAEALMRARKAAAAARGMRVVRP